MEVNIIIPNRMTTTNILGLEASRRGPPPVEKSFGVQRLY